MHSHHIAVQNQTRVRLQDVAPQQRAGRDVRRIPRGRPQRERDGEVGVVVDLDVARDPLLGRAAVAVTEALGDVPDPRRGDPPHTARADELVEQRIRYRTHELEIPPPLADDLVPGRERDQRLEGAAHRDSGPIRNEPLDGLGHRHDLAQLGFARKRTLSAPNIKLLCAKARNTSPAQ